MKFTIFPWQITHICLATGRLLFQAIWLLTHRRANRGFTDRPGRTRVRWQAWRRGKLLYVHTLDCMCVCVIVCNCVCARAYGVQSYLSIYLFIEVFKFCTSTNIVAEPPPEGRKKKRLCAVDQVRCISRKVAWMRSCQDPLPLDWSELKMFWPDPSWSMILVER